MITQHGEGYKLLEMLTMINRLDLRCPSRVSQKYQICVFLLDILHVAAFMPKKVITKKIKSFQTFVLRGQPFSFYKGNRKNIQRKI